MDSRSTTLHKAWLYCTVFLTGAAVMVVELLGTRLIAPFYGASLYVWTSVISVTLIALALGYFIGGRWADIAKKPKLSLIIALSGLLTLVIPWLTEPILLATDPLGLRMGTFVSTLVLFSPSLIMLGMVGPFAVKLATTNLEGVGASTGSIYAVSTVGSVIGTLFLGFYLFPQIGSREIFMGLGLMLLILAIFVAWLERSKFDSKGALPIVFVLSIIGVGLLPQISKSGQVTAASDEFQTQFAHESMYGWVRVIDQPDNNLRVLTVDGSTIGAASISDSENAMTYQKIVTLLPALTKDPSRALLIGLGAGHMVPALQQANVITDTLEIDPAIAHAAGEYFDFKPTGLSIIGDARYEIRKLDKQYDLIILDVFTGGSEPIHLLTVETLTQLKSLLTDDGILALNFVAFRGEGNNPALASVSKTLAEVFPHQNIFISEPGIDFNDFIFLAADHDIDLTTSSLSRNQKQWLNNRRIEVNADQGFILTDNYNPLEQLQIRKSEYYRQVMMEFMGNGHFVR